MGISRLELWSEFGGISIVAPMLIAAYERESQREWRDASYIPTSFYISNYPGDDPYACGRAAVYSLMALPKEKPIDPPGRARMDLGKAQETEFVKRLAADGVLLSGDENAGEKQTKFGDPHVWSSGAVDSIVLPFGWTQGHIIEMKLTGHEKLMAMQQNPAATPFSHSKYVRQIKTYIGYAHDLPFAPKVTVCEESWAVTKDSGVMGLRWCPIHESLQCKTREIQLDAPDSGTLIYASREEPLTTMSYFFGYDAEHMRAGREKLAAWRAAYEQGVIPDHPREAERKKWSVPPCQYCDWKKFVCKPDYTDGVKALTESHAHTFAKSVRPQYDYASVRAKVFARWEVPDPLLEQA